jgi:hypothetical protein
VRCGAYGFTPASFAELLVLLGLRTPMRIFEAPAAGLLRPSEAAPPTRIVMHPTPSDFRAPEPRDTSMDAYGALTVARRPQLFSAGYVAVRMRTKRKRSMVRIRSASNRSPSVPVESVGCVQ